MKKALITGINGQDGSYLAEYLLELGYEVHGIKRRSSSFNTMRIDHLFNNPEIHNKRLFIQYGDLTDSTNIIRLIKEIEPDEVYNLAAMSHVHVSFQTPEYTANADGVGALRILEAIRLLGLTKKTKIYQASTSELYGLVQEIPQSEKTPFYPRSPYAIAKLYAYWITINYREAYGMFACNGILFNHESPRRGETFVTRKITMAIAKLVHGIGDPFFLLGNLNACRDWGHAKDYVEGMHLILQQNQPDDFVLATGITTSIREFVRECFNQLDIEIGFRGKDDNEVGYIIKCKGKYQLKSESIVLKVDKKYFRPTEVDLLIGDASKAKNKLNWSPKYTLKKLIDEMIKNDIELVKKIYLNK